MSCATFEGELRRRLEELEAAGLRRELRVARRISGVEFEWGGDILLSFSTNDYLGLADHPDVVAAAGAAAAQWGGGSRAARLISGSFAVHAELEEALAQHQAAEASLVFSSGYAAALGTVPALVGPHDLVVMDRRVHACLVDAARLSGARLQVFRHNDLESLESILRSARRLRGGVGHPERRVLILTESVFSMDGDLAPLRDLVELKDRYGAWLLVDEAHAVGVFGSLGEGLLGEHGLQDRVEVRMGTLGKALAAAGGFVVGSRSLIEVLVHRARSFVFSTAPVPAATGAALAALRLVRGAEGRSRRDALWQRVRQAKYLLQGPFPSCAGAASAILPLVVGDERQAVALASLCRTRGLWLPAIRYPTVPRGAARLRVTLTAAHTADQVERLGIVVTEVSSGGHASPPT